MGRRDMHPPEHASHPAQPGVLYDARLDIAYLLLGFFLLPLMPSLTQWVGRWILLPGMAVLKVVQWVSGFIPNVQGIPPSWPSLQGVLAWWLAACLSAFVWSAVLVVPVGLYAGRYPCLFEPREQRTSTPSSRCHGMPRTSPGWRNHGCRMLFRSMDVLSHPRR